LDDSYFGDKEFIAKQGSGSENKAPVLVAMEVLYNKRPKFFMPSEVPTIESKHIEKIPKEKG